MQMYRDQLSTSQMAQLAADYEGLVYVQESLSLLHPASRCSIVGSMLQGAPTEGDGLFL